MHFVSVFLCVCVYVCVNVSYESFAQTETKQTNWPIHGVNTGK